jgi:hypothetical protein
MPNNSLHSSERLKAALFSLPIGMPLTANAIGRLGISRQLVHRYVQNGWLKSLGYGYFQRTGDEITLIGAVSALQDQGLEVHIGGKSALSLRGVFHYLALGKDKVFLYGLIREKTPAWFTHQFAVERRTNRLFGNEGKVENRFQVNRLNDTPFSPFVSGPERALLELLADVPQKQSLDEARKIMEPLFTLRSDVMQSLLEVCTSIKVKMLFFSLAKELGLPVLPQLDVSRIEFGTSSVYIRSKKGNSLVLKRPGSRLNA